MKKVLGILLAVCVSSIAYARPFSTAEEMDYLKSTIGQIASSQGFALDESSITLESWGDAINTFYNVTPFRLITGPTDDRAYTVYFRLNKGGQSYNAKIHFRTTQYPYCGGENNTSVRGRSSLNGQYNCLSLHVSYWANDLDKTVTVDAMLNK